MDRNAQPGIKISQILLERAEFSHREDFLEHPPSTQVDLELRFSFTSAVDPDNRYAISKLGVATASNDQLYDFAFELSALLEVDSESPNFPLEEYGKLNAWTMLFSFLRETVANVTGRGRFGAVWLPPINIAAAVKEAAAAKAVDLPAQQ